MRRLRVGQDEIRFTEANRAVAETVAVLLPEIRTKGEQLVGSSAPRVRVVVTSDPPRARNFVRPTPEARAFWGTLLIGVVIVSCLTIRSDPLFLPMAAGGLAMASAPIVWWVARTAKGLRVTWPHAGGILVISRGFGEPVIAVHWPLPALPPGVTPLWRTTPYPREKLGMVVAHEYGHLLLRHHYRSASLPPWLDEGYAFWFAEQVVGCDVLLPETRAFVEEPDPEQDSRALLGQEAFRRLFARYCWEMRSIADRGLLPDLLKAPLSRVAELRPTLRASRLVETPE